MIATVWIPAFAGMTGEKAGMTGEKAGMNGEEIGNDGVKIRNDSAIIASLRLCAFALNS